MVEQKVNKAISLDKAKTVIKNKALFYRALVAVGYFLPSEKSSVITVEFLKEVREGSCYCPKI